MVVVVQCVGACKMAAGSRIGELDKEGDVGAEEAKIATTAPRSCFTFSVMADHEKRKRLVNLFKGKLGSLNI